MRFLVLLIAYVAQRKFDLTLSRQHDLWASEYLDFLEKQLPVIRHNSTIYLAIGIVLPAVLLSMLLFVLNDVLFGSLVLFVNFIMLFMCLGCGYLKATIDSYLKHWLEGRYQAALESLHRADIYINNADELSQAEIHHAVCSAYLYQTFQRYFMVIFWFMLAGPVGALVARLAHVSSVVPSLYRPQRVRFLSQLLEWLPARVLSLTFVLTFKIEGSVKLAVRTLCDPRVRALDVLESGAASALGNENYKYYPQSQNSTDVPADIEVQLIGLRDLLNRALLVWFVLIGATTFLNWLI